jgi:methionine biosynthesis protein MetW
MPRFAITFNDTRWSYLVERVIYCECGGSPLPGPINSSVSSPDDNAAGFLSEPPIALRYDTPINTDPREVSALIAGFVPERARVLDVGCGTGCVSTVIQQLRSAHIVGIEPDAERAKFARDRGIEVVQGFLTKELVARLGRFDAVVFADVLEHLPNPMSVLQLGCSALERDGVVVISVPNIAHWSVRWDLLRGRFDYEEYGIMDATHLRWFTADSLGRWLQNNGLVVQAMAQSAGIMLPVYECAWPWRLMPKNHRSGLIRRLARRWPLLFGCQHVVRASPIAI